MSLVNRISPAAPQTSRLAAPAAAPPRTTPAFASVPAAAAAAAQAAPPQSGAPSGAGFDWNRARTSVEGPSRHPWLGAGKHHTRLVCARMGVTRKNQNMAYIDYEIMESTNPTHMRGTYRTWGIDLDNVDMAPVNLLKVAVAHSGYTAEEITADPDPRKVMQVINSFFAPEQPLQGTQVVVIGTDIKTSTGRDFTKMDLTPVTGCTLKDFDVIRQAGRDPLAETGFTPLEPSPF